MTFQLAKVFLLRTVFNLLSASTYTFYKTYKKHPKLERFGCACLKPMFLLQLVLDVGFFLL